MESKNELNENDIENCTWFYFKGINRFWDRDIDFIDISLDKKIYQENKENISIYGISCKTSTGAKPLHFRFDNIERFQKIRLDNKIRYSMLLDFSYYHKICDKIIYLIREKSGIRDSINPNFERIRIDLCICL